MYIYFDKYMQTLNSLHDLSLHGKYPRIEFSGLWEQLNKPDFKGGRIRLLSQ
jgi:hypothetical protein